MHPIAAGKLLGDYANHFEQYDWEYSRDLNGLKKIVFDSDDGVRKRLLRVWGFFRGDNDNIVRLLGGLGPLGGRVRVARAMMRAERHLPDGTLSKGGIITFWEEDGEYIQLMQPSVGALVAEFLIDNPTHPDAIRIAAEIGRIQEEYSKRLKNG
jgi:hypothetical protein